MRNLVSKAGLSIALFTLCACSNGPAKVETVYVKVPVPVKCVETKPLAPVFEVDRLTGNESLEVITDAYMVDRHQRKIYIGQLEAAMVGCVE